MHVLSSNWRWHATVFSGLYEIHTLRAANEHTTDVKTYQLSAARGQGDRFSQTLSWSQSLDRSDGVNRTTSTFALVASWSVAPALRIEQSIGHGRLTDLAEHRRSASVVVTTTVRSQPVASLTVDLDRADRWVDQEAGSGFVRYNDSDLTIRWSPTPLVNLSSSVHYEMRETAAWTANHFIAWTPWPGGNVDLRISGNGFRDTRSDATQSGAGVSVVWRAHPGLVIEGMIQSDRYRTLADRRTPISSQVRAGWAF
jgi:hypothetical protein